MVSGNVIEAAPGVGIFVGWGSRDASVTDNLIRNAHIGIGVSIDRAAGTVLITDNLITGSKDGAIRAMKSLRPYLPNGSIFSGIRMGGGTTHVSERDVADAGSEVDADIAADANRLEHDLVTADQRVGAGAETGGDVRRKTHIIA